MNRKQFHNFAIAMMMGGAVGACDGNRTDAPATNAQSDVRAQDVPEMAGNAGAAPQAGSPAASPPGTAVERSTEVPAVSGDGAASAAESSSAATGVTEQDRVFLTTVAAKSRAEVQASELVAKEGESPQVRDFAAMMHKDHSEASERLTRLAAAKQVQLPTAMSEDGTNKLDELRKASGATLDNLFLSYFGAVAHQESIALFERQINESADEEIRSFARDTLPVLRKHEEVAAGLQQKLADQPRR